MEDKIYHFIAKLNKIYLKTNKVREEIAQIVSECVISPPLSPTLY